MLEFLHHQVAHRMDMIAAVLTALSTLLLAHRRRAGFLFLVCGSICWFAVACLSLIGQRHIYGMMFSSAWTVTWACVGWWRWR
jgi:hypothetical protein